METVGSSARLAIGQQFDMARGDSRSSQIKACPKREEMFFGSGRTDETAASTLTHLQASSDQLNVIFVLFCFHFPRSAFVATEAELIFYLLSVCQTYELLKTNELEFKAQIPADFSFKLCQRPHQNMKMLNLPPDQKV